MSGYRQDKDLFRAAVILGIILVAVIVWFGL